MRPAHVYANVPDEQYHQLITALHQQWRVATRAVMILPSTSGIHAAAAAALTYQQQAVFFLRWLLDGTRMIQLVHDNDTSTSGGYERSHETTAVLAAQGPGLHAAWLAANAAGYDDALLDGTLIESDRVSTPAPRSEWTRGGRPNTRTTAGTFRSCAALEG